MRENGLLGKYETIDSIDECQHDFALLRLHTITDALGEDEYDKVIAKVQRKWDQVFGELQTNRSVSFKPQEVGKWIEKGSTSGRNAKKVDVRSISF